MTIHPNFKPLVGALWVESLSDDELILNELKRLNIKHNFRRSKADHTMYGNNKRLVLRHLTSQAILIWEKQHVAARQFGIICRIFVNNSQAKSEDLLWEAMKLARMRWIEYKFYVRIDEKAHPKNAESIFVKCGWVQEKIADDTSLFASDHGVKKLWN